jgi:hypothetical protein
VNGRLRTGCLSGLPQHATAHLVVEVIDAHRRAKLDDLIAASLDSDFIWRPARRAASRLGFNPTRWQPARQWPARSSRSLWPFRSAPRLLSRGGTVISRRPWPARERQPAGGALKVPIR